VPHLNIPLNHKLTFDSQYSLDSLYSTEQFGVGGRYTVRGFEESQVTGDHGYYIQNDIAMNSSHLFPDAIKKSDLFNWEWGKGNHINYVLSKSKLGLFYDYGHARSKIIDEASDKGYMSGIGAKLDFAGKYLDWDLTYSRGLRSANFLRDVDGINEDKESIYLNVGFKLSLF